MKTLCMYISTRSQVIIETQERVIGYVAVTIRKVHKKTPCPKPHPHKVCIYIMCVYARDCACECVLKDLGVQLAG